ncbi:PRD domain-containing protein [[Clostridium] innocuum]|nr:PRD domain-containing protein [[Clostridium] innocuum]MCR0575511.1 PRD domain-containing protein [[Clostridium] innocuum]
MKIKKILNNSALSAYDEKGNEVILIGRGISFNKHPNDEVDTSKIEKVFTKESTKMRELKEVMDTIPEIFMEITSVIVKYAKKKLLKELDNGIYINLTDHIFSAVERYRDGIMLDYGMIHELKLLYPKEYEISLWALDYINIVCDVELPQEECGFLTNHIIAAEGNSLDITHAKKVLKIVKLITEVVFTYYKDKIDQDCLFYSRFITHLKYLAIRYLNHDQILEDDIEFKFTRDMQGFEKCITDINSLLLEKNGSELTEFEKNYLILHLNKLVDER